LLFTFNHPSSIINIHHQSINHAHAHAHVHAHSNPTSCAWGQKAFRGYLTDPTLGRTNDSTLLLPHFPKETPLALKLDYGTADKFYNEGQLLPENFVAALKEVGREGEVEVGRREGYDHSSVDTVTSSCRGEREGLILLGS
jgi:S-formylglutathione hydrolase FrmB